ncbi:MAG: chitobiase/beta-hexosaminidase C-terminal domain-containing protein [Muribaculaceae bacterium]
METVKTPVITVSTQTQPTDPVTVTIACETAEPTIKYTITNGSTTGDELTYSAPFTISDPGSYTINAYAMKDGMNNSAAATPVSFTIAKPARVPEAVEELFLVMEKNFWNVDGKYPETVVPFVYNAEQGYYDLDISAIPATGTYGEDAINGGFMGEFYVRDGKANNLGLVFSAEAPVSAANMMAAYAVTPAQNIEQGVEYNMSVKPAEATSFKKFTTSNIAYKNGTLRVTYTPGKKDASAVKTLQILNSETVTGINAAIADSDAPVEYFNLQGVRIAYPQAGQILIRRQGDKVEKILF